VFLSLGALLFIYAEKLGIQTPTIDGRIRTDLLFPEIAMNQNLGKPLAIVFIIGLIAAAYSSADSALTSLTTSFSVDFLNIEKLPKANQKPLRKKVHVAVSLLLIVVVIIFNNLDGNVVGNLFKFATFTYGPLLGLFSFGILTKYKIKDSYAWIVAIAAMTLSFAITYLPESMIGAYKFHWEILPLNGLLTFVGLYLIREK
jgi:Na+/proline symporter